MPGMPRYLFGALLLVVCIAALAGFALEQIKPQGLLLYTPGPNEEAVYTAAWRIGVILGLTAQGLLAGLLLLVLQLLALGRPEQRQVAGFQALQLTGLVVISVAGIGTLLTLLTA
jgi:hypothetical protein